MDYTIENSKRSFGLFCRKHLDCSLELTKQTRDGGFDLFAFDAQDCGKLLVEVKLRRGGRRIGIAIVDRFAGVLLKEGARKGIVVTNSTFTSGVRSSVEAYAHCGHPLTLDLRDRRDVLSWLEIDGRVITMKELIEKATLGPPSGI